MGSLWSDAGPTAIARKVSHGYWGSRSFIMAHFQSGFIREELVARVFTSPGGGNFFCKGLDVKYFKTCRPYYFH
jgi:hypothetical protein